MQMACFIQWGCNSSETGISYACHKCFEWKVFQCLKKNQEWPWVYHDTNLKDGQPYADVRYREDADNLTLIDVANDFVSGNSDRLSQFGHSTVNI